MPHNWIYSDNREFRKCSECLMEEFLDTEETPIEWKWLSTEDFMDSLKLCDPKENKVYEEKK